MKIPYIKLLADYRKNLAKKKGKSAKGGV